jgi:hypothetical protein
VTTGSVPSEGKEAFVSMVRRLASCTIGLATLLVAAPCHAQGNIDAGRTPAQIFSDTCTGCHRSARELKRASASFLRQHYTAGSEEASAMAGYLAGLPAEPRPSAQPKRPPAAVGDAAEAGRPKQEPKQQAKQEPQPKQAPQPPAEQARSAQLQQPKGGAAAGAAAARRPGTTAEVRPAGIVEDRPPAPAAPPVPLLEPFEE